MGSRFGFDKMLQQHDAIMHETMQKMAAVTQAHFVGNIDKGSFDNEAYEPVKRSTPPSILNVTGNMKSKTANSLKTVTASTIEMVNDATDPNTGFHYSSIHNEGEGKIPKRSFMKQDAELTKKQLKVLKEGTGKIWRVV